MVLTISVGIPAYNEENNIGALLTSLMRQRTSRIDISEIIVVSSGSTDRTDMIVEDFSKKEDKVILLKQGGRKGKASAINKFLNVANNDIIVLESADTVPEKQTIERLCSPFENDAIGMAGAHPIPVNDGESFMQYSAHLLWSLHDRIALRSPKCGELVAFRRVFNTIPEDIAADEAWIEYEIRKRGYRIVYVPDAVVYNKGSETIGDFLKQRRRVAYGHLDLRNRFGYEVSSWNNTLLLSVVSEVFPFKSPRKSFHFIAVSALEGLARFLAYYDYHIKKKEHAVWEISKTTKSVDIDVE